MYFVFHKACRKTAKSLPKKKKKEILHEGFFISLCSECSKGDKSLSTSKSSRLVMLCKKGVLKNFAKFSRKYLRQILSLALGLQLY